MRAYSQDRTACQQSTAGRKLVVNHGNATLLILDSVTQVGHPPSKTVVFVSLGFFLKARAETSFCLKEERSATAAPAPPPPCSKRTPTRFHRRLVGTLSRALLGTPPSLAKQVAKIATRGRSPPRCFCCCLVWEKVWRYLGMGILPSQLYLDAATPLSPEHTFPVAPGCQPQSSTTLCLRLDVFRSSTSTPCACDYLGAPTTIYGDFTGLYCISMKANMYSLKFHL